MLCSFLTAPQVPTLFNKIYSGILANVKNSPPFKQKAFDLAMQAGRARRHWLNDHSGGSLPWHLGAAYSLANKVVFSKILQKFGGNLRFCMSGGAPLSNDIQDFFADMGIPILQGYGLTETSPLVVCEQFAMTEKLQGGMKPIPGVTVSIRSADGTELSAGGEGEICVEGRNVMVGYLGNTEETDKVVMVINGRRVFKTGDMGKFAPDGSVLITGRIKEQYVICCICFIGLCTHLDFFHPDTNSQTENTLCPPPSRTAWPGPGICNKFLCTAATSAITTCASCEYHLFSPRPFTPSLAHSFLLHLAVCIHEGGSFLHCIYVTV